jgi:hypothetical protein
MRFDRRSALVLALVAVTFTAACKPNEGPTAPPRPAPPPPPPSPGAEQVETLFSGSVQLNERQAGSADSRYRCVLDRLRADRGRVDVMLLGIMEGDPPLPQGEVQSGLFAVEGARVYRRHETPSSMMFGFSGTYPSLNTRYVDGCPPIDELEAVIFDLTLPHIEDGAIRGPGSINLRIIDLNWSQWDPEPNSEFVIAVEVDLQRQ